MEQNACESTLAGEKRHASKLLNRKLPSFQASKSFEAYAANGAGEIAPEGEGHFGFEHVDIQDAPTVDAPLEERVDSVLRCVASQNSLREPLYKVLAHCTEERLFSQVESFIQQLDESRFGHLLQTPHTMVQMLVNAGGLAKTPVDEMGEPLGEEALADPDVVPADYLVVDTEAGLVVVDLIAPQRRLEALLAYRPHRKGTYLAMLAFCREPRTFSEIKEFYESAEGFAKDTVHEHHTLAPDFYIDKLASAGGLVWQGAWVITPAGEDALARA
ncbi:hypothetical protein [Denitrobacterium detoxificans]|uniref:hypothetical protein n=1 Tax=Denitrobacterium detoxificans TaxID=79604 RepID=UPI0026EDDD76|nr:hypothetical protein [Denitrobacterium detoxificans]MBE6465570.1 hypothetical protein [Denitrobacterium detoxificans]